MKHAPSRTLAALGLVCSLGLGAAPLLAEDGEEADWLTRSNEIAYTVLEMNAHFVPEFAGQQGIEGYDEEVIDLKPNLYEREMAVEAERLAYLEAQLESETDPRVRQDIEIMIKAVEDGIESSKINYERVSPYGNLAGLVFFGFNSLLDKQVPAERHPAALVRLKKYTGQAEGYEPLVEDVKRLLTERMAFDGLIMPYRGEVEQDLERAPVMMAGLPELFEATELEGWEDDLALLTEQFAEYNEWVRENIFPVARPDAALPRELYELALKNDPSQAQAQGKQGKGKGQKGRKGKGKQPGEGEQPGDDAQKGQPKQMPGQQQKSGQPGAPGKGPKSTI